MGDHLHSPLPTGEGEGEGRSILSQPHPEFLRSNEDTPLTLSLSRGERGKIAPASLDARTFGTPRENGAASYPTHHSSLITHYSVVRSDCLTFLAGLPDSSVDVIVTDPAYSGMNRHMMFGNGRIVGDYQSPTNERWFDEFHDDPDTYRVFLAQCRRVLRDNRHLYLMFDSYSMLTLGGLVREFFDVKNVIVWDKVKLGMGHYFRRRHELIVFATKGSRKLSRRDVPDVWRFPRIHPAGYPTQKPVELFETMLRGSVGPGDVVCDPFVGSGSSAIAALKRGCSFVGCDLSEKAVAFAENRVAQFRATGRDPAQPNPARVEGESYAWLDVPLSPAPPFPHQGGKGDQEEGAPTSATHAIRRMISPRDLT